jgi:hypothetical protein
LSWPPEHLKLQLKRLPTPAAHRKMHRLVSKVIFMARERALTLLDLPAQSLIVPYHSHHLHLISLFLRASSIVAAPCRT